MLLPIVVNAIRDLIAQGIGIMDILEPIVIVLASLLLPSLGFLIEWIIYKKER